MFKLGALSLARGHVYIILTTNTTFNTYLTVTTLPIVSGIPFICPIKMVATASYSAVPSMLTVAPIGMTNLVTLLSMPLFSSRHRKVMGIVAPLNEIRKEEIHIQLSPH